MFKKHRNDTSNDATEPVQASESSGTVERAFSAVVARLQDTVTIQEGKPSFISDGFAFTGDVVSEGSLLVDGRFAGNLRLDAVTIGPRGSVEGTITCGTLHVKGIFRGTAECTELVVDATATLDGAVTYREMSLSRGASVQAEFFVRRG